MVFTIKSSTDKEKSILDLDVFLFSLLINFYLSVQYFINTVYTFLAQFKMFLATTTTLSFSINQELET